MITSSHVVKILSNVDVHLEIFQDPYIHLFRASSLCFHIPSPYSPCTATASYLGFFPYD